MKKNLLDFSSHELNLFMKDHGVAAFRGAQIRKWLYQGVDSFDEMTDISKDLRAWLSEYFTTGIIKIKRLLKSSDGTCKFLFDLGDGNYIESVLMKYSYGYSACISSQIGCKMGCRFCASTGAGYKRNLTVGEMIGQIITMNKHTGVRIGHVVIMGVGEPMDNYDNVVGFLREAQAPDGLGISFRHLALSTCGIVPGIEKLCEENMPITLAVSLHSPFDHERSELMPVNRVYNIEKVIDACRLWQSRGGRRITFEYAMIKGVNDDKEHAKALAELIKDLQCHVNLIPMNDVPGTPYKKSEPETVAAFTKTLEKAGIEATVRRELGKDISAACGQLRRSENEN